MSRAVITARIIKPLFAIISDINLVWQRGIRPLTTVQYTSSSAPECCTRTFISSVEYCTCTVNIYLITKVLPILFARVLYRYYACTSSPAYAYSCVSSLECCTMYIYLFTREMYIYLTRTRTSLWYWFWEGGGGG